MKPMELGKKATGRHSHDVTLVVNDWQFKEKEFLAK
jgi:hypothetical protein